jgi:hypothetical protein
MEKTVYSMYLIRDRTDGVCDESTAPPRDPGPVLPDQRIF